MKALRDPHMLYAGQSEGMATSAAGDLIRLYELRSIRSREVGLQCSGIDELLLELQDIPRDEQVSIEPFQSKERAVTVLLDASGKLLSCVTVERRTIGAHRNI
jgi:hypothetical protein